MRMVSVSHVEIMRGRGACLEDSRAGARGELPCFGLLYLADEMLRCFDGGRFRGTNSRGVEAAVLEQTCVNGLLASGDDSENSRVVGIGKGIF